MRCRRNQLPNLKVGSKNVVCCDVAHSLSFRLSNTTIVCMRSIKQLNLQKTKFGATSQQPLDGLTERTDRTVRRAGGLFTIDQFSWITFLNSLLLDGQYIDPPRIKWPQASSTTMNQLDSPTVKALPSGESPARVRVLQSDGLMKAVGS